MARKQFVSSKKNAPSRAVSSKEAALHGRAVDANGGDGGDNSGVEDDDDDVDVDGDDSSGSDTPGSPASSNGSSLLTSDDEDELNAQGNGGGDVDTSSETPVAAVEVMPSSVGRGKQLRFPTVISRGKESRVFTQDGGSQDDDNDSDSDSLLSIASDEEEEDDKSVDDSSAQPQEDATMLDESEVTAKESENAAPEYPIKGFRARKRHRPDSGYYKQMSTYVRDCLLSVRDGAESADVFTEESHDEFRRKLSAGTVERVAWKEASPAVDESVAPVVTATKSAVAASEKKKEELSVDQVKKEKHRKEHRTKEKRSESSSGSKSSSSSRKREEAAANVTSSKPKDAVPEATKKSAPEVKREEIKKEMKREEKNVAVNSVKAEPAESARRVKVESTSSASKATTTTSSSSSASNGTTSAAAEGEKSKASEALCSSCKKKLSDDKPESEKPPPAPKKTVTIAPEAKADPVATFLIPTATGKDVARLRADASRLNEEARALKHEGNRKGSAEPGAAGQIAQGKCYLRSSAKFFQHALKLADIKAAYKELNDERHARTYGEYCVTTLSQTSSLIESTIRTFQNAGSTHMVALGYKLASIVHLTIYRLQHLKLFSLYTDLFTPGRSPDTRQNGTPTPPIGGSNPDSKEAAVRSHLLKEMEHTLRGFEMWRRYESCKVVVLPRITNPAITDLTVLFEDLHSELGSS